MGLHIYNIYNIYEVYCDLEDVWVIL